MTVKRKNRPEWIRSIMIIVFLCLMSIPLIACGIKPGSMEPPPGSEDTAFPRTYPDPSTDPKP